MLAAVGTTVTIPRKGDGSETVLVSAAFNALNTQSCDHGSLVNVDVGQSHGPARSALPLFTSLHIHHLGYGL